MERSGLKIYAADFETTSYNDYLEDGYTRVYLWALQNIYTGQVIIGYDVASFINQLGQLRGSVIFFHNLKFDGKFIVDYLLRHEWTYGKDFECVISHMNEWFSITLKRYNVTIKDSFKKFPGMSIESIAKMYGIKGKDYLDVDKRREPGYVVTDDEIARVTGDVRILAFALKDVYDRGINKDTASSDAFAYFKKILAGTTNNIKQAYCFKRLFPPIYKGKGCEKANYELDLKLRRGYTGGWTWLNPLHANQLLKDVSVIDRNSMYPSVMTSFRYPVGHLQYRQPGPNDCYIIEIEARFHLKSGKFPFIQSKEHMYHVAEMISDSDEFVNLVMAQPLYELFHENYDVIDEVVLNRWVFQTRLGIFYKHINHFYKIKQTTKDPGERMLAKLHLNSLYGKFGQNPERKNKEPMLENDEIHYKTTEPQIGTPLAYLPVAMFVTAYARKYLIEVAQKFGDNFVYADTDSIHFLGKEIPPEIKIHPTELGAWKLESENPYAKYIRPKVYIHGDKNMRTTEIKAAGAPLQCKQQMNFNNLEPGVTFKGKLQMLTVKGGCVLKETTYKVDL